MGLLDLRHDQAVSVEHRRGKDKDGTVDEKCRVQRDGRVPEIEPACSPLSFFSLLHDAGLDQGAVQIQVVRHYCGTQNADRNIETLGRQPGMNPEATPAQSGFEKNSSMLKQTPMIPTKTRMNASIFRMP